MEVATLEWKWPLYVPLNNRQKAYIGLRAFFPFIWPPQASEIHGPD
jgi:hypothetical protein